MKPHTAYCTKYEDGLFQEVWRRIARSPSAYRTQIIGFHFCLYEETVMRKIDEIKAHFSEHKELYIGIGIGAIIGVAVTPKVIQVIYKSPGSSQTVIRRMHPGNVIKCDQTGEIFASQRRAADLLGISKENVSKHLNGKLPDVNGFTFTKLGEAQPS